MARGCRILASKPRSNRTIPIPVTTGAFFGANVHIGSTYAGYPTGLTASSYVSLAQDLGIRWYRTNNCNTASAINTMAPYFTAMKNAGIEPFIVIDQGINLSNSYATNYSAALSMGQAIGQAAAGLCRYFECSNEQDFPCRTDGGSGAQRGDGSYIDGSQRTDFDNNKLAAFFGWNTGMADGIRQYITDAMIGFASGAGFGAYIVGEMWAKGMDNTGTVVRSPVKVNFQGVHWYWSMGNPRSATPSGGSTVNVMQQVWSRMGCPSIITEWGSAPSSDAATQAAQASQLTTRCQTYWDNRVADNTAAAFFYAMFPNPNDDATLNWGLVQSDGTTKKPSYTAYQSFIASPT